MMETAVIQRQYDSVISLQYDQDPQFTTGRSLDRAIRHLNAEGLLSSDSQPLRVLDVGMGTGMFLEKLRLQSTRQIAPSGLDISEQMAALAVRKLPDLVVAIDDGANLDRHFGQSEFDLVATHFVTGFVELEKLAADVFKKLAPGGCWSFVGGTTAGYAELQRRARHPLLRMLFGSNGVALQGMICPESEDQVTRLLSNAGFEIRVSETFEPELKFEDFSSFMEYGYHGGWLTPFIEDIGLQNASRWQQALLNRIVFPVTDHHSIVLAVARKPL